MTGFIARLRSLFHGLAGRRQVEAEMDEELQFHIAARTEDLVARGLEPSDARRRARREFGSLDAVKEQGREARGLRVLDELRSDARYGARALRRAPGFALVAVLTLALGIGATTAIFSALDAVLLRPLPFAEPDRLVRVNNVNIPFDWGGPAPDEKTMPDIHDARGLEVFSDVAAFAAGGLNLSNAGPARRINVGVVTHNFFSVLGVPVRGRSFMAEEGAPGGPRVVIVSHGFWRRHLGSRRDLSGLALALNGRRYQIVGVAPRGFLFPEESEVWIPMTVPTTWETQEAFRQYMPSMMVARMREGITVQQAESRALSLRAAFDFEEDPDEPMVAPLHAELVGERRTPLLVLLGATALVLLVACANVANLLLSRGAARSRELAVRAALGATPARVTRQLLVESVLLALIGSVCGLLVAHGGVQLLDALVPKTMLGATPIRLDARVLTFTLTLALTAGIAFGLLPALMARRTDSGDVLKSGGSGAVGGGAPRVRQALVVAEIALAVMLVIGSALMLRSLHALMTTDAGVNPERVATLELSLAEADYPTTAARRQLYERLLERLDRTPGIEAAGIINELPLRGVGGVRFTVYPEGRRPERQTLEYMAADLRVTSGYFAAMGIAILRGRAPEPRRDTTASREVAISRSLARQHWPDADPVGQRLELPGGTTYEIVGVVADVLPTTLESDVIPQAYYALLDSPYDNAAIAVRGRGSARALVRALEDAVRDVAPSQAIYNVRTMEQVIASAIAPRRLNTALITSFGVLALVLAAIGVYGVVAFSVAQRTREIGIRIALGARARDVRAIILRDAGLLAVLGIAIGLGGAWALSRVLTGLLYGVGARDPWAFAAAPLLLLITALIASLVPARRAARVDPVRAIRQE